MPKETIRQTIGVAAGVCVVCSVLVSTASVCLKKRQDRNKTLEKRMNILMAAGLLEAGGKADVDQLFQQIDTRVVDLSTHDFVDVAPEEMNPAKEAQDPDRSIDVQDPKLGIKRLGKHRLVYLTEKEGRIERVVLPVVGKGLWSTMYGFLALDRDMTTIKSLAFYEHGETPGLGGEVDNPNWKRSWIDKQAFDQAGKPAIKVVKGQADPDAADEVDGLSGATLTSRGVENLVRFWLGEEGYGPVLEKLKAGGGDG
jgi:Na+-transporting NADH:ubiquinone oxidoreductase subunit C